MEPAPSDRVKGPQGASQAGMAGALGDTPVRNAYNILMPSQPHRSATGSHAKGMFRERERAQLALSMPDTSRDAVVACAPDGTVMFWNKGAERMFGWTRDEAVGCTLGALMCDWFDLASTLRCEHDDRIREYQVVDKNGRARIIEACESLMRNADGTPHSFLMSFTDITWRRMAEAELRQLSMQDPLTSLPNRPRLREKLQQSVEMHLRHELYGAVLLVDLDGFQSINGNLGQAGGDQLLKAAARRMKKRLRDGDCLARIDADQFAFLGAMLGGTGVEAAAEAALTAHQLLAELRHPFGIAGTEQAVTACIGIAVFGGKITSSEAVLAEADAALRAAKACGPHSVRYFDHGMRTGFARRIELQSDLRHALARREIDVHYQIQVDEHGRATGAEALARWMHPEHGSICPSEFVPLAEEAGLICLLGQIVMEKACETLASWSGTEFGRLNMAVNVSSLQLREPDFVQSIAAILRKTGANPNQLKLEITESALVEDVDAAICKMAALKEKGVLFSVDDFGTGYSSLAYLKVLPLDQLKIDRAFVKDISTAENDVSIASAIIALANALRLHVIAEGVETDDQRIRLREIGCKAFQGNLFGVPMPREQLEHHPAVAAESSRGG